MLSKRLMAKYNIDKIKNGDILLLNDGLTLRVIDVGDRHLDHSQVEWVDANSYNFVNLNNLNIDKNLKQSPQTLALFYGIRGIHIRLNALKGV